MTSHPQVGSTTAHPVSQQAFFLLNSFFSKPKGFGPQPQPLSQAGTTSQPQTGAAISQPQAGSTTSHPQAGSTTAQPVSHP